MSRRLGADEGERNHTLEIRESERWLIQKKKENHINSYWRANCEETNIMISYQVLAGN